MFEILAGAGGQDGEDNSIKWPRERVGNRKVAARGVRCKVPASLLVMAMSLAHAPFIFLPGMGPPITSKYFRKKN